jgi:fructokinase
MVYAVFPHSRLVSIQLLTDGLRNANFKLELDTTPVAVVLRIYEHDVSLCQKELDLILLVGRSVPVPEVLYAEPNGWEGGPPFALYRFVEGISFRELARRGDRDSIAQAAHSAGAALAMIGQFTFARPGWLAPGPTVTAPLLEGANPIPRFVDLCLASADFQRRSRAELRDRVSALVWSRAQELTAVDNEACLVHGDFGKRNLLVRNDGGKWSVAAVLDWEFAVSGSPLADLGHFLRYERSSRPIAEPYLSNGYLRAGGKLSEGWREIARLLDLAAMCESLTHDDLPDEISAELVELVLATVEERDPQLG